MAVRKKEGENLDDKTLEKVFNLLNADVPISKTEACRLLNIAYNTSRLEKILSEYADKREHRIAVRKKIKNTPMSDAEIKYIIEEYLYGKPMDEIVDISNRSATLIKRTLRLYNIPMRDTDISYHNPLNLEDSIVNEDYKIGDLVFSARYNSPAIISKRLDKSTNYRIWVYNDMQYAVQPFYELADLTEVQNRFNIKIEDMPIEEIHGYIREALTKARK